MARLAKPCGAYYHPHEGKNCRCLKLCINCGHTKKEHYTIAAVAEESEEKFTFDELRIALTAFAMWLLKDEIGEGREVELVDQFIAEQQ